MNITSNSMSDGLANLATNMQSNNLGLQFSTAIMKNVMDNQKQVGEALVKMINSTPSLDGTGAHIDIRI
jgi:hypothetical protein